MKMTLDSAFQMAVKNWEAGQPDVATSLCEQVLRFDPDNIGALNLMAVMELMRGHPQEAMTWSQRAIASAPDNAELLNTLGEVYRVTGALGKAERSFRAALTLDPDCAHAHFNLGLTLSAANHSVEAIQCMQTARRLEPDNRTIHLALSNQLRNAGEVEAAEQAYSDALQRFPEDGLRVRKATLLPVMLMDADHITPIRAHYREGLDALEGQVTLTDPVLETEHTNFFLAYHGRNDRPLQERTAQFFRNACPSLEYTAAHCRPGAPRPQRDRIKVGIISRFLKWHSIGRTSRGLIANLPRDHFEVITVRTEPPPENDHFVEWIDERSDRVVTLPIHLATARERIEAEAFDILYYQDIGMDPMTYFLAFARLAPVQCVAAGHPVTTGIPNLDYFISSTWFEPPGAEAHYSETLVSLEAPHWYYYRPPPLDAPPDRAQWGLSEDENIYLCPQTLFKLHPHFDAIICGILEADPKGRIVLIGSHHLQWQVRLSLRLQQQMPSQLRRISIIPGQPWRDFLSLLASADVILDPLYFGGYNTTLEAFAMGTPIVTMPGAFQRGRHTAAFCHRMGLDALVVDSIDAYIETASRLGRDRTWRDAISAQIQKRSDQLYEDPSVISEHTRFFIDALNA
ncbi:MAG: tetratricopeptide repeat protein [Myxococcota bacterium]